VKAYRLIPQHIQVKMGAPRSFFKSFDYANPKGWSERKILTLRRRTHSGIGFEFKFSETSKPYSKCNVVGSFNGKIRRTNSCETIPLIEKFRRPVLVLEIIKFLFPVSIQLAKFILLRYSL
jgi:hypothetical protein